MTPICAQEDAGLSACVRVRHALHYRALPQLPDEPEPPRFVRAGSSLSWFAGKLAVVQDDSLLLGLIDSVSFEVDPVALPLRADGARTFDVVRGNKKYKPDFEASFSAVYAGTPALFALGSGSHDNRESFAVVVQQQERWHARLVHVPAFYAALRAAAGFLSSELNLEGAVLLGESVRLFQRSNGTLAPGYDQASCASCDVAFAALHDHLADPVRAPVPRIENVRRYDLGRIGDARLTFTDAALRSDGTLLYCASAERSPNAYEDGSVAGSAIGVLSESGARYTLLRDERAAVALDKAEGLALLPGRSDQALVVIDPDDHTRPACLAELTLRGF